MITLRSHGHAGHLLPHPGLLRHQERLLGLQQSRLVRRLVRRLVLDGVRNLLHSGGQVETVVRSGLSALKWVLLD